MLSCRPSPAITIFTSLAFSFSTIPCWYFFQYKWTVGKIFFWKEIKWHFIFILYWFQLWQRIIFIVELIQLPGHELTILSELAFTSNVLTAWCLKYVFKEIHDKPMFLNTKNVFDGEAPDTKTEKHSKKFIAIHWNSLTPCRIEPKNYLLNCAFSNYFEASSQLNLKLS